MQNQLENRAYAGFFARWLAYCIDIILANLVMLAIKIPCSIAASNVDFLKTNILFHFNAIDIVSYLGVAAYFVLITYYSHTTIGKSLLRLQVVSDKEWTFINVLYRETVGRFLSSILCIGYLAAAVTPKKQGFHDMLCDTYVVYKDMYVANVKSSTVTIDRTSENVVAQTSANVVAQTPVNASMDMGQKAQNSSMLAPYVPTEQVLQDQAQEPAMEQMSQNQTQEPETEQMSQDQAQEPETEQMSQNQTQEPATGAYRYYDVSKKDVSAQKEK